MTVNGGVEFARWSRQRVAQVAGGCWVFLIILKFVRSAVGWSGHGALFWIVYAPLAAGFVGAGLLWVALAVRDVVGRRRVQAPVREALAEVEETVRRCESQSEPGIREELAAALLRRAILARASGPALRPDWRVLSGAEPRMVAVSRVVTIHLLVKPGRDCFAVAPEIAEG